MFDEPWKVLHNRVEGVLAYTNLLFIPSAPPFDLFDPDRKPRLKLYVKRVFITDDCEALLPSYLRFVRGIVDSEDLSLNISREMLQNDPKLAKIRSGLVKRILGELKKASEKDAEGYAKFWDNFGAVLKEGLYEDFSSRDSLVPLCRFRSIAGDGLISLDDYVDGDEGGPGSDLLHHRRGCRGAAAQPAVGRLPGARPRRAAADRPDRRVLAAQPRQPQGQAVQVGHPRRRRSRRHPAQRRRGWQGQSRGNETPGIDQLVAALKMALGESVKDVRTSDRLTDSPVCLVADDNDMDLRLERMLRQHRQLGADAVTPRILEINPKHALIRRMADRAAGAAADDAVLADAANLLLDQARIVEGEPVADPMAFMRRMTAIMEKGLGAA